MPALREGLATSPAGGRWEGVEGLELGPSDETEPTIAYTMSNVLYCGDNLEVLAEYIPDASIDLIYLDPPFNSKRTFNVVYGQSRAQEQAFKDYWSWEEAASKYVNYVERGTDAPRKLRALLKMLHDVLIDDDSDLLAYLTMMAPRLVELHRVLKDGGTMYLHCDPTAGHYLKVVLDAIFYPHEFINEIVWQRTPVHSDAKRWSSVADIVLMYAKGEPAVWNPVYVPHNARYLLSKYRYKEPDGRIYRLDNMTSPNPRKNLMYEWKGFPPPDKGWRYKIETMRKLDAEGRIWYPDSKEKRPQLKRYLKTQKEGGGTLVGNVWTDIAPINSQAKERVKWPTQKPLPLLDRILSASSNKGQIVLDPFCGCGTAIVSAEQQGRRWIGIDIARKAVDVLEERFEEYDLPDPSVVWHPADPEAAIALAERDPAQFEAWVRRKLRAEKRRKDRGIDGESFYREDNGERWHVIISVKGGQTVNPAMVRELRGTIEREREIERREPARGPIGVLVCTVEPSREMKREAALADFLSASDVAGPIPRIQIITVEEMFGHRSPVRAPGVNITPKPAPMIPERGQTAALFPVKTKKPSKAQEARALAAIEAKEAAAAVAKEAAKQGTLPLAMAASLGEKRASRPPSKPPSSRGGK